MSHKSAECYTAVFKFVEDKIFKFEPTVIMTDWETGLRCALRNYFSGVTLKGCWFHYCSALRKNMIKLGLFRELKKNANARMIKKMLMSLPLLPTEMFKQGYSHIKKITRNCGLSKKFKRFFTYFNNYWNVQVCLLIRIT